MTYALTEKGIAQWGADIARSSEVIEDCPYCSRELTFKELGYSVFCSGCNTNVLIENGHLR